MALKDQDFTVIWNYVGTQFSKYTYISSQSDLIELLTLLEDDFKASGVEVITGHSTAKSCTDGFRRVAFRKVGYNLLEDRI